MAIQRNLSLFGPFAATERVLAAASKAGADRQMVHEHLRRHALDAWEAIQAGVENPLRERICQDEVLRAYLSEDELRSLMDATHHIGDAPERARRMAQTIREAFA